MANNYSSQLDFTFGALADPTRRAILARLARGETTPTELARPLSISKPALSKHLRILERSGLMRREISGRVHKLSLVAHPLQEAQEWINTYREFWDNQLDALQNYLAQSWPESNSDSDEVTTQPSDTEDRS